MADDNGKAVRLILDPPDHQRLRVIAANAGMTMAAWVKRLVLGQIEKDQKEQGK